MQRNLTIVRYPEIRVLIEVLLLHSFSVLAIMCININLHMYNFTFEFQN